MVGIAVHIREQMMATLRLTFNITVNKEGMSEYRIVMMRPSLSDTHIFSSAAVKLWENMNLSSSVSVEGGPVCNDCAELICQTCHRCDCDHG